MEYFEMSRPLFCGLLGGTLAILFCRVVARWVPQVFNGKSAHVLMQENRLGIAVSNILLFAGILVGIGVYHYGLLPESDWRGLALGVGVGCICALVVLPLLALLRGNNFREAYVAYAISQGLPVIFFYVIFVVLIVVFAIAFPVLL